MLLKKVIGIFLILFFLVVSFVFYSVVGQVYNNYTGKYTFQGVDDGFSNCLGSGNPYYGDNVFSAGDTNAAAISKQYLGLNATYFKYNATVYLNQYLDIGIDSSNDCSAQDINYVVQFNTGLIYIGNQADYTTCSKTYAQGWYNLVWIQNKSLANVYVFKIGENIPNAPNCSYTFPTEPSISNDYIALLVRDSNDKIDNVSIEFNSYIAPPDSTYINLTYLTVSSFTNDTVTLNWNISTDSLNGYIYTFLYRDNVLVFNSDNLTFNSYTDYGLQNNTEYFYLINVSNFGYNIGDSLNLTIRTRNTTRPPDTVALENILTTVEQINLYIQDIRLSLMILPLVFIYAVLIYMGFYLIFTRNSLLGILALISSMGFDFVFMVFLYNNFIVSKVLGQDWQSILLFFSGVTIFVWFLFKLILPFYIRLKVPVNSSNG